MSRHVHPSERHLFRPVTHILAASLWWAVGRPFDVRNGVRTEERRQPGDMQVVGSNAANAYEYAPSPARTFWLSVGSLTLDPTRFTFVDYGSGMGRALLLAGKLSYRRVEGIEFARDLNAIAAQNLATVFPAPADRARFRLHTVDATDYRLPLEPCVIYLFNPFGPKLVEQIADIILRSFREMPREIYLVYVNPRHKEFFERPEFQPVEGAWYAKYLDRRVPSGFVIYRLHSEPV